MIQIKAFYGDWAFVSREQAEHFVRRLLRGMTAVKTDAGKFKRINERHLRGITAEELLCAV